MSEATFTAKTMLWTVTTVKCRTVIWTGHVDEGGNMAMYAIIRVSITVFAAIVDTAADRKVPRRFGRGVPEVHTSGLALGLR